MDRFWEKIAKLAKKIFFARLPGGFRPNWRFRENLAKTFKSLRLVQKWCWEAQLWLEINYGSFLTKCRKQNFNLGPIFHFLAQNSRFWPKMAILGQFLGRFSFIKWSKRKINKIPLTESWQILFVRILSEEFCLFCFLTIL